MPKVTSKIVKAVLHEDSLKNGKPQTKKQAGKPKKGKKLLDLVGNMSSGQKKALEAQPLAIKEKKIKNMNGTNGMKEIKKVKSSASVPSFLKVSAPGPKDGQSFMKFLYRVCKKDDSKKMGEEIFSYILAPHFVGDFFKNNWESKHLLIKRNKPDYFNGLFSAQAFDSILRKQYVEFTKNLDITSYSDGVRQTHNPAGKAFPPVVWDYFNNGCSVRLLNPQTFHKPVWQMLAGLQDYFGSFCGANIYLTPGDTQGFAPHWDDIEAFVLQLEGKKRWRVYKPRNKSEVLPRYSSANLTQEEIGSPLLDVVLEPGDLLYFPRGFIHQAEAVEQCHSLHLTLSTYQKNAWVDLVEKVLSPSSLAQAASKNLSLRKGLPLGYFDYMGKVCASKKGDARKKFKETLASVITNALLNDEVIDSAVDEMARQFVRVALPPSLSDEEKICSVVEDGESWTPIGIEGRVEIEPDTEIKLIRAHSCRLVRDPSDGSSEYRIYHSAVNSREYEGREEQYLVIEKKFLPAIECLVKAYPKYTMVEKLPLPSMEDKLTVAMALWEQNLIRTSHPLNAVDDVIDGTMIEELI